MKTFNTALGKINLHLTTFGWELLRFERWRLCSGKTQNTFWMVKLWRFKLAFCFVRAEKPFIIDTP